jgi:hypothetical protein
MRLRTWILSTVTALSATAACLTGAGAAQANTSDWAGNGTYRITNVYGHGCLDIRDANSTNGVGVDQWDCYDVPNQKWTFSPTGDGYYYITANHSGKCLTVDTSHPNGDFGGDVNQWQCLGQTNQMWRLVNAGNSNYALLARHNGKALDLDTRTGGGLGAPVHNWTYYNGNNNNQLWNLTKVG